MVEVTGAFEVINVRHTADAIKAIYDEICAGLDIDKKVYKIVANQGANVKKAFKTIQSAYNEELQCLKEKIEGEEASESSSDNYELELL